MELPKPIVVLNHATLPFEDLDANTRLVVNVLGKCLSLIVGKVVLRSMSFVMTSAVFKPIDKGVISKNSRFCTCEDLSPMRMAACTAAVTRPSVSRGCTLAPNHWSRTH